VTDRTRHLATRGASTPSAPLPAGAWDTHAHVFGPFDRYPISADSRYQPPLGPRENYLVMLDLAGFSHGVLVHASANGFDNSGTRDAVAEHPQRLRGIAVIPETASDAEFGRLHAAGFRGIRFTENGPTLGTPGTSGTLGLAALRRMAPKLRVLGWHAQVWAKCQYVVESLPWMKDCGIPLVFDHMGMYDVTLGVDDPTFQSFLRFFDTGQAWVKLITHRVSKLRWNDCSDVRPFHDALVARAPERVLWGTDWPYIGLDQDIPSVGGQLDLLRSWSGEQILELILVSNPQSLYGARG
jgi:2-pyrone-4,6-dicarboxylate lactonase